MEDRRGVLRGSCNSCECQEYELPDKGHACNYCLHTPTSHSALRGIPHNPSTSCDFIPSVSSQFIQAKNCVKISNPRNNVNELAAVGKSSQHEESNPPNHVVCEDNPSNAELSTFPSSVEACQEKDSASDVPMVLLCPKLEAEATTSSSLSNEATLESSSPAKGSGENSLNIGLALANANSGKELWNGAFAEESDLDKNSANANSLESSVNISIPEKSLNVGQAEDLVNTSLGENSMNLGLAEESLTDFCEDSRSSNINNDKISLSLAEDSLLEDLAKNSMDMDLWESEFSDSDDNKQFASLRVRRPCFYCGQFQSSISRHLLLKHGEEKEVQALNGLSPMERSKGFRMICLKGIAKDNLRKKQKGEELIGHHRVKPQGLVECDKCLLPFNYKYIYYHKQLCPEKPRDKLSPEELHEKFYLPLFEDIVNKFHNDAVGNFIKTNEDIQNIGIRLLQNTKNTDSQPVRKQIMSYLRCLAKIYLHLCSLLTTDQTPISLRDMFQVEFVSQVVSAINELNVSKHKYRTPSFYTHISSVKAAANEVKLDHLNKNMTDLAQKTELFITSFLECETLLKSNVRKSSVDKVNKKEPGLPHDAKQLLLYVLKEFEDLLSPSTEWNKHNYMRLRKCVICRLVFFNDMKISDVVKLKVSHWLKAKSEEGTAVLPKLGPMSSDKQELLQHIKVAYVSDSLGMIEIAIPESCYDALDILSCPENRKVARVNKFNPFVFASTGDSKKRSSGMHLLYSCCAEAKVNKEICSDQNRRFASASFAAVESNPRLKELLTKCLGRSFDANYSVDRTLSDPLVGSEAHLNGVISKDPSPENEKPCSPERRSLGSGSNPLEGSPLRAPSAAEKNGTPTDGEAESDSERKSARSGVKRKFSAMEDLRPDAKSSLPLSDAASEENGKASKWSRKSDAVERKKKKQPSASCKVSNLRRLISKQDKMCLEMGLRLRRQDLLLKQTFAQIRNSRRESESFWEDLQELLSQINDRDILNKKEGFVPLKKSLGTNGPPLPLNHSNTTSMRSFASFLNDSSPAFASPNTTSQSGPRALSTGTPSPNPAKMHVKTFYSGRNKALKLADMKFSSVLEGLFSGEEMSTNRRTHLRQVFVSNLVYHLNNDASVNWSNEVNLRRNVERLADHFRVSYPSFEWRKAEGAEAEDQSGHCLSGLIATLEHILRSQKQKEDQGGSGSPSMVEFPTRINKKQSDVKGNCASTASGERLSFATSRRSAGLKRSSKTSRFSL